MAVVSSRTKWTGSGNASLSPVIRNLYSSSDSASSRSILSSKSGDLLSGSSSPTRINMLLSSSSVKFAIERATSSPVRKNQKKACMCSPTTHPGSFRCSLHKNNKSHSSGSHHHHRDSNGSGYYPSNRLNARRSAMTNSLVRICGVEGEMVKRALAVLIRPTSHSQRRRSAFQARPSRLSVMSNAVEL